MRHAALLATVGSRVRAMRDELQLSRRELAERSGVSERYLAQLESGTGNISLVRLADVSLALGTTPAALLANAIPTADRPEVVALLGVRGAGKSTIGRALAARRQVEFVELDQLIEREAGLPLAELFELHGESYYRRLEREALRSVIAAGEPLILATGGSIVGDDESFSLLRSRTRTVWLKARAEDHWNRVIEQGDRRPMAENPHAFAELEALLAARAPLYRRADHVIDTSGRAPDDVVADIDAGLRS